MFACDSPNWRDAASAPYEQGLANHGRRHAMALKAPGILIFLLSIILALAVLFTSSSARPFRCLAARPRNSMACSLPTSFSSSAASCAVSRIIPDGGCVTCRKLCALRRAAKGALAQHWCQRLYLAMEKRSILRRRLIRLRAQRWSREALLAVILTIAAVVFIATAMVGKDLPGEGKEAVARTPQNSSCGVPISDTRTVIFAKAQISAVLLSANVGFSPGGMTLIARSSRRRWSSWRR